MRKYFMFLVLFLGETFLVSAQSGIVKPVKLSQPTEALSKVNQQKILQKNSCQSLATLGGSIRKENYLKSVNKSLLKLSNNEDYAEWFVLGPPFIRQPEDHRVSLGLTVRADGQDMEVRETTAKVVSITGTPKIKAPIKIPLRKTSLEDCDQLDVVDSFVKKGRVFAETESVALSVYDLKDRDEPPVQIKLNPGQEIFLENKKVCNYEGQAYFARFDFFDEYDFWQNNRKAFSRQKTNNGTVIKFFDGSSLLVDDREGWFSELGLARLTSFNPLKEDEVILSAAQLDLKKGDKVKLEFSNGLTRTFSIPGKYCYQIEALPLEVLLSEEEEEEKKEEEEKSDEDKPFSSGVNNVNACRPSQYPPNDKSNSARMDRIRGNMCKTFSKDVSTRQNGVHINQPHQVPNNLTNRGQNSDGSCDSPPAPRSKQPRNKPEGRKSVSDRYDEILNKNVYGHDQDIAGLADAGGASAYGDTSYVSALRSVINFKAEKFNRDTKKMERTRETEAVQTRLERESQSQEEEFKANKLKNCQMTEYRHHMEDLAGKPKVSS